MIFLFFNHFFRTSIFNLYICNKTVLYWSYSSSPTFSTANMNTHSALKCMYMIVRCLLAFDILIVSRTLILTKHLVLNCKEEDSTGNYYFWVGLIFSVLIFIMYLYCIYLHQYSQRNIGESFFYQRMFSKHMVHTV